MPKRHPASSRPSIQRTGQATATYFYWYAAVDGEPFEGEALFIRGGRSKHVVLPDDEGLIKTLFPKAEIKTVEGAGHWVHAEKPEELLGLVRGFLNQA